MYSYIIEHMGKPIHVLPHLQVLLYLDMKTCYIHVRLHLTHPSTGELFDHVINAHSSCAADASSCAFSRSLRACRVSAPTELALTRNCCWMPVSKLPATETSDMYPPEPQSCAPAESAKLPSKT